MVPAKPVTPQVAVGAITPHADKNALACKEHAHESRETRWSAKQKATPQVREEAGQPEKDIKRREA